MDLCNEFLAVCYLYHFSFPFRSVVRLAFAGSAILFPTTPAGVYYRMDDDDAAVYFKRQLGSRTRLVPHRVEAAGSGVDGLMQSST